ncbi:MAG: hypothetical protein HN976_24205 [Lentisphaerae bacterium]|nr:hypothetical protein [Lentisphaerota bacterium]
MTKSSTATATMAIAIALSWACTGKSWGQDAITARLHPSGVIELSRGAVVLGRVELNAHGPNWQHAPQTEGKGTVDDLADKSGKRVSGVLVIPNTEDGAIEYIENVKTLAQGLQNEYDLTVSKIMKLNGLQVSVNLPVEQYAGKEVLVSQPRQDPKLVGLPEKQQEGRFQLWSGQGSKAEIAKDTDLAITAELRASTDVMVQDLRQWDNPIFEVRFPAIMEGGGREVTAGAKFHLDLTITCASSVKLVTP